MPARPRSWRDASAWLLLAGLSALAAVRAGDLSAAFDVARATRPVMRSPADFERALPVLGPEHPLLEHLRTSLPAGAPVALEGEGRFTARRQRFWIALLPEHPIRSGAPLVICPAPCRERDRVLARGEEFWLVRRDPAGD